MRKWLVNDRWRGCRSNVRSPGRVVAREQLRLLALGLPAFLVVTLCLGLPVVWLTGLSLLSNSGHLTFQNYIGYFGDTSYARSFWLTAWIAMLVTFICATCGYLLAYAITLMPATAAKISLALVAVPFWTSVLVRTYSWLILLQNEGLVNKTLLGAGLISSSLHLVYNLTGTLIGMVHIMMPFMVSPLYAGLRRIDANYVKAAIGLGALRHTHFGEYIFLFHCRG